MLKKNYNFFYKNITRFILLNKLSNSLVKNTYNIPYIRKLKFFFTLNKLEDLDDVQIYIIYIYLNFFLVNVRLLLNINLFLI